MQREEVTRTLLSSSGSAAGPRVHAQPRSSSSSSSSPKTSSRSNRTESSSASSSSASSSTSSTPVSPSLSKRQLEEEDTAVIRKILLFNEIGLKKFTQKYLQLAQGDITDPKELHQQETSLLSSLESFELGLNNAQTVRDTNAREIDYFTKLYSDLDQSIGDVREEITQLKQTLQDEKTLRQHKEEYDSLAKVINSFPSRSETTAKMDTLKKELEELGRQRLRTAQILELRSKQFALLLHTIQDLQRTLQLEEGSDLTISPLASIPSSSSSSASSTTPSSSNSERRGGQSRSSSSAKAASSGKDKAKEESLEKMDIVQ
ncbi:REJ domain-containing protein [Balamuthia mandrillaris]